MMRAIIVLGVITDIAMALFLLLVSGWIVDSWRDPKGAWVGVSATALWLGAFVLSAGAPILGRVLKRRGAAAGRVALAIWAPGLVLVASCALGFLIFPL
jgi:hypothetical protein